MTRENAIKLALGIVKNKGICPLSQCEPTCVFCSKGYKYEYTLIEAQKYITGITEEEMMEALL